MNRTILVVLLLVLVLPSAATAKATTDPASAPRHGDIPATFSVAAPFVGDAGSYSRSVVRWDGETVTPIEPATVRESFLVESPRDQYDRDGHPHRTNAFHTWFGGNWYGGGDVRYMTDATDGALVATTTLEARQYYYENRTYFPGLANLPPVCGLTNVLQNGDIDLAGTVRLFPADCRRAYFYYQPTNGGGDFVAVRSDPWGSASAIGFQQVDTDLVLLAWFVPDVPYPVRILEQMDRTDSPQFALLDLTAFQRGISPTAAPGSLPAASSLAPIALRTSRGIGADETGISHPFPWSAAWTKAQTDSKVAAFLSSHPRAVVSQAVYNEQDYAGNTLLGGNSTHSHAWFARVDDGSAAYSFTVKRTHHEEHADLPVGGPVQTSVSDTDQVLDQQSAESWRWIAVATTRLPTVTSATTWWQAYATPHFRALGSNGWLHNLACDCDGPFYATSAGYLHETLDHGAEHWEASYLVIDQDGHATMLDENIYDAHFGPPAGFAPAPQVGLATPLERILREAMQDQTTLAVVAPTVTVNVPKVAAPDVSTPAQSAAPSKTAGQAPLASQADASANSLLVPAVAVGTAGVIGLGLLGKFLLGLFSRLRRDKALDHSARRALMDAIEAEPGIHLARLQERTGRGAGVVRHHLGKLVEAGLVTQRRGNGYLCFFPDGASKASHAAAPALKAAGARKVLDALRGAPAGLRPLATRAGLAPSTVEHHVARLQAAGLVERRDGLLGLTAAGREA